VPVTPSPLATVVIVLESGKEGLQDPLPPVGGVTTEHEILTADVGTSVQSVPVPAVKFAVFAATLRVQVLLFEPCETCHKIVVDWLPATADPGLFAVNETVAGVAVKLLTFGEGPWAKPNCAKNTNTAAVENARNLRIPRLLSSPRHWMQSFDWNAPKNDVGSAQTEATSTLRRKLSPPVGNG
jgi:hypothetical protein